MTNQNNAAQAAINTIIAQHFSDDPAGAARALIVVNQVLSKLRAPVATSQAAHVEALRDLRLGVEMDRHHLPDGDATIAALDAALALLRTPVADESVELPPLSAIDAEPSPHGSYEVYESEYVKEYARSAVLADRQKRAALASAPVAGLPERDATKRAQDQGLFHKFDVRRTDGSDQPGGKHHKCRYFVLDVDHDPHAAAALGAYAAACERTHPALASDLREKWGAPVAGEAQPVAWMLVGRLKNSEPKFTLADPAGIYDSVYVPLYAAPQASEALMRAHARRDSWSKA